MGFHIFDLIKIAGALAFFIYGMKVMSDGIQRAAGDQIRNILRSLTKNRIVGFLTGLITTGAVQSSSVTTVMTVSLVNAGLISLKQSAGLIIGANIGTTVTAWIIAGIGFKLSIQEIILPVMVIGVPLALRKKGQAKYYGEFIVGFAILFLGLNLMTQTVPDFGTNEELLTWFQQYSDTGPTSIALFLMIGIIVTILIQSSSAAMALTLTVCLKGWLPYELGAAMILGENIGTTLTAEIAALVGNVSAKRCARIHTFFNILGAIWMALLLPLFIGLIDKFIQSFGYESSFNNPESTPIALAAFHTLFNILNGIIFLMLTPSLIKLAVLTVPDKKKKKSTGLKFISYGALTPELNTDELQRETAHFAEIVSRMTHFTINLLNAIHPSERIEIISKIRKYEEISDNIENEITQYISEVASRELTKRTSSRISNIFSICNDLERIGDIYMQVALDLEKKNEEKIWFSPDQRNALNEMLMLLDKAFIDTVSNLGAPQYSSVNISGNKNIEEKINNIYFTQRNAYLGKLDNEEFNVKGTLIFYNIVTLLENIGNHLLNINQSIIQKDV